MARRNAGWWSRWAVAGALLVASVAAGARAEGPGGAGGAARSEPDPALVELGRRLFFEPALSAMGERSCASCHDPAHGFSDPAVLSADDGGPTPRHSQTLIDVDARRGVHWDGGIVDLQEVARRRMRFTSGGGYDVTNLGFLLSEAVEFESASGNPARDDLGPRVFLSAGRNFDVEQTEDPVLRLGARYGSALLAARGRGQTMADLCTQALATYVTTLRSNTAPYDRFVGGESTTLSESARRGLDLFRGRAGCAECHSLGAAGERAPLRDGRFHNTGVAWRGRPKEEQRRVVEQFLEGNPGLDEEGQMRARLEGDLGRGAHDPRPNAVRTFKTPTLRDVARHPPYMHDGSLPTLASVVRHYAGGCGDDAKRDPRLKGFEASEADVADLVAFLEALTSETRPGLAPAPWVHRVPSTRLRFVDAAGRPLAGLKVTATPAGDFAGKEGAAAEPFVLTTDDQGQVKFDTTPFTHVRLALADGLPIQDGAWIPDSCREATLTVPVAGVARLAVIAPSGMEAPDEMRLWRTGSADGVFVHERVALDLDGEDPRSENEAEQPISVVDPRPWRFVRHGSMKVDGKTAALYTGWCPEGGRKMLFRLSGQKKPQSVALVPDEIVSVTVLP